MSNSPIFPPRKKLKNRELSRKDSLQSPNSSQSMSPLRISGRILPEQLAECEIDTGFGCRRAKKLRRSFWSSDRWPVVWKETMNWKIEKNSVYFTFMRNCTFSSHSLLARAKHLLSGRTLERRGEESRAWCQDKQSFYFISQKYVSIGRAAAEAVIITLNSQCQLW